MKRAAILIGVNETGTLPPLADAVRGAKDMEAWAHSQNFDDVTLITDENGPVHVITIKQAVENVVNNGTFDQLVIYFAGHGVNLRYSEYWLLSRAPVDTQAAVNLQGSVVLARQCSIPHIVFISDACRTAADGIQAQQVTGSEIFPNNPVGGPEKPVDIFFATILGKPSQEVRDPNDSASQFQALYTTVLTEALEGQWPDIVESATDDGQAVELIRPRPLRDCLGPAMTARLKQLRLHLKVYQVPDARITSDPDVWISRLAPTVGATATAARRSGGAALVRGGVVSGPSPTAPPTLHDVSAELLDSALSDDQTALVARFAGSEGAGAGAGAGAVLERGGGGDAAEPGVGDALVRSAAFDARAFGPGHFETACGFKLRGATVSRLLSAHAQCELLDDGELVRIHGVDGPSASVLLVLPDQSSVLVPAIPEFLAGLTFHDGELADVAYEPSDNSGRWAEYQHRREEIRMLRGVVSASARYGVFQLEGPQAEGLAERMQYSKMYDPALALYAAYAYNDQMRKRRIQEMNAYLQGGIGMTFFDIALLARELDGGTITPDAGLAPPVPLLGQGWALLGAHRVELPASLAGVEAHLRSSLWTQFTPQGTALVEKALANGEVW